MTAPPSVEQSQPEDRRSFFAGQPSVDLLRRFLRRPDSGGADGVESGRFLGRWVVLSLLIGVVAGLGAIVFYISIGFVSRHVLGAVAGVYPPEPFGEGGNTSISPFARPWLVPVITTLGGLVSGVLVYLLAPEAQGHGTDAAISSFHFKAGQMRARIVPVKLIASAITIGTGGSAGREGPVAQISAGFGSLMANVLRLSAADRRICVAVGMGAGIGAIFRAPLGGAMLAAEILYLHDLEAEVLLPSLIASIVGYTIFGSYTGWSPIFGTQGGITFNQPIQLVYFAALGLLCGLVGLVYARGFYRIEEIFHRLPMPQALKPALGGLLVGLLALVMPQVLGTGYGWVQIGMDARLLTIPLWVVLLLPFAKILATSLSIGSGGSGGIFGPGMVIGGMLGAAFWRLGYGILPGMPAQPASFTIVAMMALFGGVAHAPLAVMLMVAEMTGNLTLLAPAMVAVGLATLVVGDQTIYRSQLPSRVDSPAHRYRYAFPLLSTLTVGDALAPAALTLTPDDRLDAAAARLDAAEFSGAPVLDEAGAVVGILTRRDLARIPHDEWSQRLVRAVMSAPKTNFDSTQPLDDVLDTMAGDGLTWAPVLDKQQRERMLGTVSVTGILAAYRGGLRRTVRRASGLAIGSVLIEAQVTATSPLRDRPVHTLALPGETLLVSYRRGDIVATPNGATVFEEGDVITLVTNRAGETEVRRFLETTVPVAPITS